MIDDGTRLADRAPGAIAGVCRARRSTTSRSRPRTADLALMRRIDELHLEHPFAGSRMLRDLLKREGYRGRPQARGDADAPDGHRGAVPEAEHQSAGIASIRIYPVSAARRDHRPPESGLGDGHHLHSDGARLRLSDRGAGLGHPPGPGVATVEQPDRRLLRRSAGGGDRPLRRAGDHEHRPGQPIHRHRLHRTSSTDTRHPRSAWTARAAGATTCSSSGCGRRSSTRRSICMPTRPCPRPGQRWPVYLDFYNRRRPHSTLDRQTPDDVYFNQLPLAAAA